MSSGLASVLSDLTIRSNNSSRPPAHTKTQTSFSDLTRKPHKPLLRIRLCMCVSSSSSHSQTLADSQTHAITNTQLQSNKIQSVPSTCHPPVLTSLTFTHKHTHTSAGYETQMQALARNLQLTLWIGRCISGSHSTQLLSLCLSSSAVSNVVGKREKINLSTQ